MLSKVYGAGILGTDGYIVCCEADVGNGLPQMTLIGYLSNAVKEAQDRVRTSIRNSGFALPPKRITINLSPADIKKDGTGYDLPIAIALLVAYGYINDTLTKDALFAGELSLDGSLHPINGALSMVSEARNVGFKRCFLPMENAQEGSCIEGIDCIGISSLKELIDILNGEIPLPEPISYSEDESELEYAMDMADINGQEFAKRAMVLSAAGRHNILLIGPAGTGKSMIASRIPTILPLMTKQERLEVSKIYSVSGLLRPDMPLLKHRPFRDPHHTISPQALAGGGTHPRPGEISLATHGVLFLDELPEFHSDTLEILRQPLEEKKIRITRLNGSFEYPANFMLVCAMNPCKCGFYPDRSKCNCSEKQVRNYIGRISKPLLDRIDICIETSSVNYNDLRKKGDGTKSHEIRKKIEEIRAIQAERFKSTRIRFNSEMSAKEVDEFCQITHEDDEYLKEIYEKRSMSARGLHKILKVARTIADYEGCSDIKRIHLAEAVNYRSLEKKFWGARGFRV